MSDFSSRDITKEMLVAFETYWTAAQPTVPIAFPNDSFDSETAFATPDDGDAWVRVFSTGFTDLGHVPLSGSTQTNFFQESGRITFEIYTREGQGVGPGLDLSHEIQGFFDDAARVANVIFSNRTAAQVVGGDGAWYQMIQAADWLYFTDRVAP